MPIIDLDPSDMSCIFSTLSNVSEQARQYKVTPALTFDQPLFYKATIIVESEPSSSGLKSVVLRLGGLHTQMSFLGCIGHLMASSGLEEILELVYAGNAVSHIMTGKAISRAIRGHLMINAALNTMLAADAFDISLSDVLDPGNEQDESEQDMRVHPDLTKAAELYNMVMEHPSKITEVLGSEELCRIEDKLLAVKVSMKDQGTARLWLQYLEMVGILRNFIKAERTGNWLLHLQTVQDMLPYFAASGHNLYTKSAYLYLQKMQKLPEQHPDVYEKYMNGLHVIRRSERYWAGLSTDLIIEQVLMRSMKTNGGLTRGRGMTEVQRLVWLLSMPACADISFAMQELSGVNCDTSEQHKDITQARQKRDMEDTLKMLRFLQELEPFSPDTSLRGLVSGQIAHESVNVDTAKQVGQKILDSMVGKSVKDFSFQKKKEAVTLAAKLSIKVDNEIIQVDPQLLFQRLSVIATNGSQENPEDMFKYELCTYPTALFDRSGLPHEANKPALADTLWNTVKDTSTPETLPKDVQYVLDGGALIQRLPWTRGYNFESICNMYVDYVVKNYGWAVVVFDGYEDGPSVKDSTHQRRGLGSGPKVVLKSKTVLNLKKKVFLANKANKQRFICLLTESLEKAGCQVIQARGDADVLIAQTAIEAAKKKDTVLVGDDTDLLVLLIYHVDMTSHKIYFKPEPKSNSTKIRLWNIQRTKEKLGPIVCKNILFVHAVLGCDTTSRVFGIGKAVALTKIRQNSSFLSLAEVFHMQHTSHDAIIEAGEKVLFCLYNAQRTTSLDKLRYQRFQEKVTRSQKYVEANSLPPTSAAAKYHSLRVYYQVQQWMGRTDLNPEEWGWKISEGMCTAVKTDLPPAPKELLKIFRCNCKTGCTTERCACRKHRLECTVACGDCKGSSCTNSPKPQQDDEEIGTV